MVTGSVTEHLLACGRGHASEYWRSDPQLIWTALTEDVREVERMVRDVT